MHTIKRRIPTGRRDSMNNNGPPAANVLKDFQVSSV